MKIRIVSVLLALLMLLAFAAGCSSNNVTPSPDAAPSAPVTGDPAASGPDTENAAETQASLLGVKLDDVAARINGSDVTNREFLYWANATYNSWGLTGIDLNEEIDGTTIGEILTDNVLSSVKLYRVVEAKCNELGIKLTDEDEAELAASRENMIANYGSEEAYLQALDEAFLTEDLYNYMLRTSFLYSYLFEEFYGPNGEKCSDEEAVAYGTDNGYLRAKHILLSKTDANGNELSEEDYAERREQILNFIETLDNAEDPVAEFDALMNEYSEDPGLANYPEGYQWIEGAMVESFETATKALDDYGYSDVVEMSTYGYTLVMRLPLDPDDIAINDSYGYTLRMNCAASHFDDQLSAWTDELSVDLLPDYEKLDYSKLF